MPLAFRTALASIHLVIQSLPVLISTTATPVANTTTPILTLPSKNIGTQCTEARTWVANRFYRRDCLAITDYIYNNEVRPRDSERFEFTSLSATTTRTDLPKIMRPRKYEYGTCVVTIAMMDRFQPRELPGSDFRERYEETDVATFDAMWHAAMKVDFECVRHGKAGWIAAGDQGSIGVLIMTSGSAEDRTIPDGPPTVAGAILAPSRFITWPNSTRLIESSGK